MIEDKNTRKGSSGSLLERITSQKLRFEELKIELLQSLLQERQAIRDANHKQLADALWHVTSDIYGCETLRYSPEARERKPKLVQMKHDLEKLIMAEDVALWRDTEEIRQAILGAEKQQQASELRASLFAGSTDEDKEGDNAKDTE